MILMHITADLNDRAGWFARFCTCLLFLLAQAVAAAPERSLRDYLVQGVVGQSQELSFWPSLEKFYSANNFTPVWYRDGVTTEAARQLILTLQLADHEGLVADDYLARRLAGLCLTPSTANLNECELLLGEAALRYARDVGHGRHDPRALDTQWHIEPTPFAPLVMLEALTATGQVAAPFADLPPRHDGYAGLRKALHVYQTLADLGGWPLIGEGITLRPGMRHADVALLRRRLAVEFPDLEMGSEGEHYDAGLEAAVRVFQQARGLDTDGLVGPVTRRALTLPVEDLVAQIKLNMERWRWLPRDLGERYLLVNVPAFELYLVDRGDTLLRMRAITGRTDRSSPSFASRLAKVVFNPSWTIPLVIAVEDLLPKQQKNPGFLASRNIRVLRHQGGEYVEVDAAAIDWRPYHKDNFPFMLRQSPGPRNSLGRVKFVMPNRFDIYLHDTPAKALFQKSVRTLSSGCIRVQQPLRLASLLIEPQSDGNEEKFRRLIEQGETRVLEPLGQIPVYLVYLTAWVEADGAVHFRDDVYGRDRIMSPLFREFD